MLFSRRGFSPKLNEPFQIGIVFDSVHNLIYTFKQQINFCSFHLGNKKQITIQKSKGSLSEDACI